ncbi:hypothetical protein WJX74_003062 [Apatococcus lobatus]|uniref:Uncharacterized protein n=1 Tax=Apatococcus lobatus TaxID=904363 RepID=A0AAW1QVD1_9CHLO
MHPNHRKRVIKAAAFLGCLALSQLVFLLALVVVPKDAAVSQEDDAEQAPPLQQPIPPPYAQASCLSF